MFCLRTWIPVLFFLANTSPLYFTIFVAATWYTNRPCLYCSVLLSILVISLYDWSGNWFEPRQDFWNTSSNSNTTTGPGEGLAVAAVEVVHAAMNKAGLATSQEKVMSGAQWLREMVGRRELKIPCLEIAIRL